MKEYLKLKSTYERDQISDLFDENLEGLKAGGYTPQDLSDANNMVYVDGFDLYLYFDGFHIAVNKPGQEILWSINGDVAEQVGIIELSNVVEVRNIGGQIPEGFEDYIGEGTIKKFYSYNIDKNIVDALDPKDPVEAKIKERFYTDHVDYIDTSVAFIRNIDGSYTSVTRTVIHFKEGDKEFKVDVVDLTESQFKKIVSLIK